MLSAFVRGPKLNRLDWLVLIDDVAVFVFCIAAGAAGFRPTTPTALYSTLIFSWGSCALLLVWMARGGATSPLWTWLPPFWPLGSRFSSTEGRWLVILALTAAAVIGGTLQWLRS
jgi:hypothetical protein